MATIDPPLDPSTNPLLSPFNGGAARLWTREAPAAVRKAYRRGEGGWQAWQKYLASRKAPRRLEKLFATGDWPIGWNLPQETADGAAASLLATVARALGASRTAPVPWPDLQAWLAEPGSRDGVSYAYEVLAWCHALPRLAADVAEPVWWALLGHVVRAVQEASKLEVAEHPLAHQLLAGEAAWTLAYVLPELTPCKGLARPARKALSQGMKELLDGEGLPHADWLPLFRTLAACWTRAMAIGRAADTLPLNAAGVEQFRWMVRNLIRTSRHDGRQILTPGSSGAWNASLLRSAMQLGGDADDRKMAAAALPGWDPKAARDRREDPLLPLAGSESEWAATAILRPEWSRKTAWLAVTYPHGEVRTELNCGGDTLWSGLWELDVQVDGRPAPATGEWEQLLWVSDSGIDYLELQIELAGGTIVQRHFVLAREDRFLLLADAVLGPDDARQIDYTGRLPLLADVQFQAAEASTEGHLAGRKKRASVLPLALPEWRIASRNGGFGCEEGSLTLRQTGRGPRLFAPLWFDLDRSRQNRPFTWRQLTVAEDRRILAPHEAVAYRVQSGGQQWTVYRTLGPRGNRTFLGHNLATSMIVARFSREGETEALVEIE